jgi:hypothetical protein
MKERGEEKKEDIRKKIVRTKDRVVLKKKYTYHQKQQMISYRGS